MDVSLRDEVIGKLKELPVQKQEAEIKYYVALNELRIAKQELSDKECKLFSEGKVKDKNELTRRTDLFKHTETLQKRVMKEELKVDLEKANFNKMKAEFEAYIMIAKLISNQDEPLGIKFKLKC